MEREIDFTRIGNDTNGNPRYVCHFLNLLNENDSFTSLDEKYTLALKRAKKIGGRKYHNKQYGGGIVFQTYNIKNTEKEIRDLVDNTAQVKFLIEKDSKNEVFAFFPNERYHHEGHPNYNNTFSCYAHIGQHSACHIDYANECKPATKKQYQDLKKELESIGYILEIIK